jgi:two-component system, OmpR family, heavy metal sensor histidine kinase CusS
MTNISLARRRPLSLNSRVMLFVAVAISLSLLTIGYLLQTAVERHFAEQDAEELLVITRAVEEALEKAASEGQRPDTTLAQAVSGHHGVYFQVRNENNELVFSPDELLSLQKINNHTPVETISTVNLYNWKVNGKIYRGTVTKAEIENHQYRIIAAIDMEFHLHFLESFNRTLWLIMFLAGAVTLLAAWVGIHQGLAPLRVLSEAIRGIQADRLDVRLDTDSVPAELVTLEGSFNHMIGRLEESFDKLSHFSADIAHELRTPLTNLITQTQVGLGKSRSLEEYRELLYSNLEEQERLTKMVNDMLWLAQTENGLLKPDWERLELIKEVKATFEFFEALSDEKNIILHVEGTPAIVSGDRAMLRRVLSNLLSNALRFTSTGEQITVNVWEADDAAFLSVENPGPEISPEHLPRLFDRFYRVDPSRQRQTEGAGLGLAIVKSIVEAHEGSINVSSECGRTKFILIFPRAIHS